METSSRSILMHASRVLALITARGGSKGLPRKNILRVAGTPLINWTVDAALRAELVDRVVLSSDDDEIIEIALAAGCDVPFRRPAELASDQSSSMDVVLHALAQLPGYEYIVLLQPTSPLRTSLDIDLSLKLMHNRNAPACVAVTEVDHSPYWMYRISTDDKLHKILEPLSEVTRRQDLPTIYRLNGAIYIAKIEWLLKTKKFISPETVAYHMPKERSLDIDDEVDFHLFTQIVETGRYSNKRNN